MELLQAVVGYWLDCVRAEGSLEQSFALEPSKFMLAGRTKAHLFPGTADPFIFSPQHAPYIVTKADRRLYELAAKALAQEDGLQFGYPLLMYFDRSSKRHRVAPLLIMKLSGMVEDGRIALRAAEQAPVLGSHAFERLGLRQEEVVALNTAIGDIFTNNLPRKLETVLYVLQKETSLTFMEALDPEALSTDTPIHPYSGAVVYNKAVIYTGEASGYNLHLIRDLEQLAKRQDMRQTALCYLADQPSAARTGSAATTPVLPFAFDEYQLAAIDHIARHQLSVVTGPPGTGKSQFIANLVINLFMQRKTVLLVSHTSEAVRVVNERIGHEFANLVMQTGKKATRQELGRQLQRIVAQYNEEAVRDASAAGYRELNQNWALLQKAVGVLAQRNAAIRRLTALLSTEQMRVPTQHRYIAAFVKLVRELQTSWWSYRLARLPSASSLLSAIREYKEQHVRLSRELVRHNYVRIMLDSGSYGPVQAYIDTVQNSKPLQGTAPSRHEQYVHAALQVMNVWSCTLKSIAATFPLEANVFDYIIFDESSQIDLPSAAPALYRAKNIVVVGDENQLTHIAKIGAQTEENLALKHNVTGYSCFPSRVRYTDTSLFNSVKRSLHHPELELKNHYRSHTDIASLFSSIFYDGRLRVYEPHISLPDTLPAGARWVDVAGTVHKLKNGSKYNPDEVNETIRMLRSLLPVAEREGLRVGVATPYGRQQEAIAAAAQQAFPGVSPDTLRILTVHKFQGSETDILIFSPVLASKGEGGSDFWYIKNPQLLNVAISRARQLLLVVGDHAFAMQSQSKLRDIAVFLSERSAAGSTPAANRPMNVFELQLLRMIEGILPPQFRLEPQYVIDGRYTVDFAIIGKERKFVIELDGRQHEIIGGLPSLEDLKRDTHLRGAHWQMHRILLADLIRNPASVRERLQALLA